MDLITSILIVYNFAHIPESKQQIKMANQTVKDAMSVKGTNPQYLVEKIIRYRVVSAISYIFLILL